MILDCRLPPANSVRQTGNGYGVPAECFFDLPYLDLILDMLLAATTL